MNERGLTVGLAADDSGRLRPDPAKPTMGSVRILRLVLDHAATVAEAPTGSVHLVTGQWWEWVYDFRLPIRR
jgi:hypothetical protein